YPSLKKASSIIEILLQAVPNTTVQLLLERIINNTGMLHHVIQSENKHQLLQQLNTFFDFVKQETHRKPYMTLHTLVELIQLMRKEKLSVPLVQITGSEKGVNLLTVHGSKGLEFEYVFFAACNANCWEKARGKADAFAYPDNLLRTAKSKETSVEEQRRLFYVALTRAKHHLYISYCDCNIDGKPTEPTMFIAEIQQGHAFEPEPVSISEELLFEYSALQLANNAQPVIEKLEEELVSHLLDRFVMNVSALNNFLKCPIGFYYQNLIRIPSPKNKDLEYGNAVHYALQELFRKMQSNNQIFADVEDCIADFNWWMKRHRESFTNSEFTILCKRGETMLRAYYVHYKESWNKIVSTERNFRTTIKGIPIRGKIDKLEFDGKSVNVVDYKTGNPTYGLEKLKPPSEKNPLGGDYWRQAVFYKILVDNSDKGWKVISTEYDFIEPDNDKRIVKEKIVVSPEDIEIVVQQISDAWQKIQTHDFYTGCGKPDCEWCNFTKVNKLYSELIQEEESEPGLILI
ncbi:MAG: 3'-5' exonuclease, partial [Parafilimonas sp.]